MQILSESQFQYNPNNNELDACFVTSVLILIKCDDTLKDLIKFKRLGRRG